MNTAPREFGLALCGECGVRSPAAAVNDSGLCLHCELHLDRTCIDCGRERCITEEGCVLFRSAFLAVRAQRPCLMCGEPAFSMPNDCELCCQMSELLGPHAERALAGGLLPGESP